MIESVVGKLFQDVETFARRDIPVSPFLNLCEQPRLNQCPPANKKENGVERPRQGD